MRFPVCSVFLLAQVALGEGHDGGGSSGGSRPHLDSSALEQEVKAVFTRKCQTCHEGDGRFKDNGLPQDDQKEKVLKALNHRTGVRPMPPSAESQLTEEEIKKINQWAGFGDTGGGSCAEKISEPSPNVIRQIFSDRCVTCHGKMSFNPTSVLRPGHHQFLNNDGTFDRSILGDMSELDPSQMPDSKTSLGRLLDSLSGYTMPPRANLPVINHPSSSLLPEVGTPAMTGAERTFAINALKAWIKKESCPVKSWTGMVVVKTGKPFVANYQDSDKACAKAGLRIPTYKQLDAIKAAVIPTVPPGGCVWTSTFDKASTKATALRKVLSLAGTTPASAPMAEDKKCLNVCVP